MKILYVADGRSPTALNWIRHFVEQGHEVHLASLFPCEPKLELASLHIIPFPLSGSDFGSSKSSISIIRNILPPSIRTKIRQRLIPSRLNESVKALKDVITRISPDIVHALRIPFEGMISALAETDVPLLISVWGNDFTLHAVSNSSMGSLTTKALQKTDALMADCHRDIRLAKNWGLSPDKPTIVLPGGGGINTSIFYPPKDIKDREPIVINPRGLRSYVRNDAFFSAIPKVLEKFPNAVFICPVMQDEAQPEKWVRHYKIQANVQLLPRQTQGQMADLYRKASVAVSPSEHDGTPNTLLEAMACGCFPVAGDIESVREWITNGENGLLVDPSDAKELTNAIIQGLEQNELHYSAVNKNFQLIKDRAERKAVMEKAERFYSSILQKK